MGLARSTASRSLAAVIDETALVERIHRCATSFFAMVIDG